MIKKEEEFIASALEDIAQKMCVAARTAPKARGVDLVSVSIAKADTIEALSGKMKEIGEKTGVQFFVRDAESIKQAKAIVLLASKLGSTNVKNCNYCGFNGCAEREQHLPAICAINAGDLGIAIGSALSVAADHRVDNRLMFSIGKAAMELGLLGAEVKIAYGIPLSVTGKNPFFDRK
jgi:uncharacterized ferredoxin-like protein